MTQPKKRAPAKKAATAMSSPRGHAQLLPGMADLSGPKGEMLTATVEQLKQWKGDDRLTNDHIALAQLAVSLSKSIDVMLATTKVSMLSNNAHELRETLIAIAGEPGAGDDLIKKLMAELEESS